MAGDTAHRSEHVSDTTASAARRRRAWIAPAVLTAAFLAIGLPLMLMTTKRGPGWGDETSFHLLVINRFFAQWPTPSLADYEATATPLYHLILTAAAKLFGNDLGTLRLVGSLFSLAALATLSWWVARRAGWLIGLLLTAPLMFCVSFMPRSFAVNPDNAGWLFVMLTLLVAVRLRVDWRFYVLGGLVTAVLVLFRQNHIWATSLIWVSAWLGAGDDEPTRADQPARTLAWALRPSPQRLRRLALAFACTLPAFLIVIAFYRLWGSLVPPMMQTDDAVPVSAAIPDHSVKVLGINYTAHVLLLAFTGLYGLPLVVFLWPAVRRVLTGDRAALRAVGLCLAVATVLAIAPRSDENEAAQRTGDVWTIVGKLPLLADRSLLLVSLSIAGGLVLGLLALSLRPRDAVVGLVCMAAFTAAHMVSYSAWQRYIEPIVLIALPVFVTLALVRGRRPEPDAPGADAVPIRLAALGALVLIASQVGITFAKYLTKEERRQLIEMVR